jgi:co-chaperonin GroES (HSP10)
MLTDYSHLNWKPTRDLCFVRELPVEQTGLIIPGIDLNRSADHSPVLMGVVEAVGPRVTLVVVGDRVAYEIGAGEFRVPGDDEVRIMKECDVACVVPCQVSGFGNPSGGKSAFEQDEFTFCGDGEAL